MILGEQQIFHFSADKSYETYYFNSIILHFLMKKISHVLFPKLEDVIVYPANMACRLMNICSEDIRG